MNFIIDIGNSRIKAAVFQQGKMMHNTLIERQEFISKVQELQLEFPKITDLLVSHVGKMETTWENFLRQNFSMLKFSATTPLPFKNLYKTPNTLGLDRIGLVASAFYKFPNKNVLIIDAGTCITYDFLNRQGEYLGGAISPGIHMRLKALHTFTQNLPLLEPIDNVGFLGTNTFESMQTGALTGALQEIAGFIILYRENFKNLTVVLTGGDGLLLSNSIKNSIFAPTNFLLEGLNAILEFNNTQ